MWTSFLVCVCSAQVLPFPSLGFGYDAFLGNPLATDGLADAGFRTLLFQFAYKQGLKTADGRWQVPDQTSSSMFSSCSVTQEQTLFNSVYCYERAVDQSISLGAGFNGVKSSFSVDYKYINSRTQSARSLFAQTFAVCSRYLTSLQLSDAPMLTSDFQLAVQNLPTSYDAKSKPLYMSFVRQFGTHFIYQTKLGGRWGQQMEFSEQNFQELLDDAININAGISGVGALTAGIGTSVDTKTIEAVAQAILRNKTFSIGGDFRPNYIDWMTTIEEKPMPVYMELNLLSTLLTSSYLPSVNNITTKQQALIDATNEYCEYVQQYVDPTVICTAPLPIPIPQPDPIKPTAISRLCVKNNAGFVMNFALTVLNRANPITAHSDNYPNPQERCIGGDQINSVRGDDLSCTVSAIMGTTNKCDVNQNPYDVRSNLQANYDCTGATLTFSCKFVGLTKINSHLDMDCPAFAA